MTEKLNTLWELTLTIESLNPDEYRVDDLGAIIKKSDYGKKTMFGWTIDHIFPLSKGGDDNIRNLQLLHWENNLLKGNDFPTYNWNTSRNRNSDTIENITIPRPKITFRASFVESLADLYPSILQYRVSPLGALML